MVPALADVVGTENLEDENAGAGSVAVAGVEVEGIMPKDGAFDPIADAFDVSLAFAKPVKGDEDVGGAKAVDSDGLPKPVKDADTFAVSEEPKAGAGALNKELVEDVGGFCSGGVLKREVCFGAVFPKIDSF